MTGFSGSPFSFNITIPSAAAIQYVGPGMRHNTTSLTLETHDLLGPVLPTPFIKSPALYPEGNFTQAKISFVPCGSKAGDVIGLAGEFKAIMSLNPADDLTLMLKGYVGPCSRIPCPAGASSDRTGCSLISERDSFCKACKFPRQPPPNASISVATPFDEDSCRLCATPVFTGTPVAAFVATRRLVQPGFFGMIASWES